MIDLIDLLIESKVDSILDEFKKALKIFEHPHLREKLQILEKMKLWKLENDFDVFEEVEEINELEEQIAKLPKPHENKKQSTYNLGNLRKNRFLF